MATSSSPPPDTDRSVQRTTEPSNPTYSYPFASSPDIIRAHQKDAYTSGQVALQSTSIIRSLLGARFAHKHQNTINHLSELLYLSITTFLGNRTLGEEYCDIIQVNDDTSELATLVRRVGYISSVVFAPWILGRSLPALRRKLRTKLEHNIERAQQKGSETTSRSIRVQEYILRYLDTLTSLSPIYALSLAAFYFTGSYYHLSKRLFGLRYIFTRQVKPTEQRVGYEVLGVLLVLQMAVQSALHIRETYLEAMGSSDATRNDTADSALPPSAMVGPGVELAMTSSFDHTNGTTLLADLDMPSYLPKGFAQNTQTPILDTPRYDAKDDDVMAWIPDGQQRKCTLCLEPFRDPSITTCGHVFCWSCVQDWVKEKAECPLCRQSVLPQKVLPLR